MRVPIDKFESWLVNKNLKPRTVQNYIYYFNKFTYDIFNQESVSMFLSIPSNRNSIARSFLLNYKKFLLVNYVELGLSDIVKANVASVELPSLTGRKKKRNIRPVPHEQIAVLENHLETEKEKLQLILSYYCGLRLGELLKITIISFDWEKWKKDRSKMGDLRAFGKGDKEGMARVYPEIMERVAKFIHSQNFSSVQAYLFRDEGKEYNFNNLARQWQKRLSAAAVRAGITLPDGKGGFVKETVVHPHRLRHSYAYYLRYTVGMDIHKIRELLRHSHISSTQIYDHLESEELDNELIGFGPGEK